MRKYPGFAYLVTTALIIGAAGAAWHCQRRDAASRETALVAKQDIGVVFGMAPVHVEWSFRNADAVSWDVVSHQQSCGCARIHLNRAIIPPGSVLLINALVDLPVDVTPEEPEKAFEQQVILPFTVRKANETYHLIGVVCGKRICPLLHGPSFLVVQFQKPSGFRRYCWQLHPQVNSKMLDVRCTLPRACASLKVRRDSVCLVVRPAQEEQSCEGDLIIYHRRTHSELLRIPIVVRMRKDRGS